MSVLCNRAVEAIKSRPNNALDVVLFVLAHMGASDVAAAFDEVALDNIPPRDWNMYRLDVVKGVVYKVRPHYEDPMVSGIVGVNKKA